MSAENVEIVRRLWDSPETTGEAFDPLVEVHDHDLPDATGIYVGYDGISQWLSVWLEAWEAYHVEAERFVDAGDRVVAVIGLTAKGKGSGIEVERRDGMVYTLRERRVVRIDYYGSVDEALDAVGLRAEAGGA
jgi:ketosteroid isomerase-like protein